VAWLAGDRIILRAVERDDIRTMWEAAQSSDGRGEELRDWRKPPKSLATMEREFDENIAEPPSDVLEFIIQADGRAVGDLDLFRIEERNRSAMIGVGIWSADDRGKGYGYDALRTVVRWAFDHLNMHRIELNADPGNAPAIRIYEKCGFQREGLRRQHHFEDGAWHDELSMGLLRADFDAAQA
jgi:RimJ/RimL family protein N-acetyltransferase